MTAANLPTGRSGFLKRLLRDETGNTLAMVAAGVFPVIALVGGAVDMSRSYMAKARLQQACDAGALSARRAMTTDVLTPANKDAGYKYFDFNFPNNLYSTTGRVRTYAQPFSNTNVPQPIVNGTATVNVPTTLMRVFGKTNVNVTVTCSSKKDVSHADVSMVLDVTYSMDEDMRKSSSGTTTETRISALRRAVKAFYDNLGPGRAGGDLTKGRIRYAVVPYGTVVNVGRLLHNDQMVDSWTYSSRGPVTTTAYAWWEGDINKNYGAFSPTAMSSATRNTWRATSNYSGWTRSGNISSYTDLANVGGKSLDATITQVPRVSPATGTETATSANCYRANTLTTGTSNSAPGLRDVALTNSDNEILTPRSSPAPVYPQTPRLKGDYTNTRTNRADGFRYRWFSVSGTSACRLERADGNSGSDWNQVQTAPNATVDINWYTITPGSGMIYAPRTISVAALKAGGSSWNSTLSVPNLDLSGGTWYSLPLSGRDKKFDANDNSIDDLTDFSTGGTSVARTINWRGCVEERKMDNTIVASTPLSPFTADSYDLDVTRMSVTNNDDTRWRPWLSELSYRSDGTSAADDCPSPALKLQEIASYTSSIISSDYPDLFDATSSGTSSYYYPYSSTAANNTATLANYINRIKRTSGTAHDPGFIWGFHLLSGQGMFASENPDYFEGNLVSRNLVFMTDGEMNPGSERYMFSGLNYVDGRLAPRTNNEAQMVATENRRLRMMCEAAKQQGITVWVVVINDTPQDYNDLIQCASSSSHYKSAATADELVASFTTIAQSIGGLRLSQ